MENNKLLEVSLVQRKSSIINEKDNKFSVVTSAIQDGKSKIIVVMEGEDSEVALQLQIEEIKEKAENPNYNWEILYIKQQMLGEGTFGKVYASLDKRTGKKFALKLIPYQEESEQDPDFKIAVKEIVIMQTLSRSNVISILKLYDCYPTIQDSSKYLVLVMELCDCNIQELIKVRIEENRSHWSDEELLYVLHQLTLGFVTMKQYNVCHRDIKPQNILYCSQDLSYKIADLGGAKFLKNHPNKTDNNKKLISRKQDDLNTVRGSPAYWAPEIADRCGLEKDSQGQYYVKNPYLAYNPYRSDVYSLAIMIIMMRKLLTKADKQVKAEVENLKKLKSPNLLDTIILSMIDMNDKTRITFDDLLVKLKESEGIHKHPKDDIYVNCMKMKSDKMDNSPLDLMIKQQDLAATYEKLYMIPLAIDHYQQALKLSRLVNKESYRADILISLGSLYCDLGQLDEAERDFLESANIYKKIQGDKSLAVADVYNNLGIVARKKGDFRGAIKYYQQSLKIKQKEQGDNNLGVALILTNIGLAYRKLGDFDESIKYYKSALQMKKLICGEKSVILCGTYDNLARVYYLKQQYDLAVCCYQITSEIYRRNISQNSQFLGDNLYELALCFQKLNRYGDAAKCASEAYKLRKDKFGEHSKQSVECLECLAQVQLEEQNFQEAINSYEQLKHMYNKGLMKCSLEERIDILIDVLKNLGAAFMGNSNYKKSMESFSEALMLIDKVKTQDSNLWSRKAKILYNMGLVYRKIGNVKKAQIHYLLAKQLIYGSPILEDQILLGDIYNNIGVLNGMNQQFDQGLEYFNLALKQYQQTHGANHQLCKEVEANIQGIEKMINKNEEQKQQTE